MTFIVHSHVIKIIRKWGKCVLGQQQEVAGGGESTLSIKPVGARESGSRASSPRIDLFLPRAARGSADRPPAPRSPAGILPSTTEITSRYWMRSRRRINIISTLSSYCNQIVPTRFCYLRNIALTLITKSLFVSYFHQSRYANIVETCSTTRARRDARSGRHGASTAADLRLVLASDINSPQQCSLRHRHVGYHVRDGLRTTDGQ